MLALASISDTLFTSAADFVADVGLLGIFVLMVLEAACIPIPSEATMLFAGFSVHQGTHSLFAVTAAGVIGNLVGSWIAFAVGRYARRWLDGRGSRLVDRHHLERADRWFARFGPVSVFFSRMLPLVRTFISLPAGASEMTWRRFTLLTLAGCIPWVLALAIAGDLLGRDWASIRTQFSYVDYAVVAIAVGVVVWLIARRVRTPREGLG